MNFREFQYLVNVSKKDIRRETFLENRGKIRVKKEETVVKNLEKIFDAAMKISNKKGFQAMSMRDLSRETGLSMGALYAYFSSKEELLEMLQRQGRTITRRILEEGIAAETHPLQKLRAAIRIHLYLSEVMQPWFFFSYMETKHLTGSERQKAVSSELYTEELFADLLKKGEEEGIFRPQNHQMTASFIKAMLQDWYLKRWKYAKRRVSVEAYAQALLDFVEAFYLAKRSTPGIREDRTDGFNG
jgi:AcrR family transcriptional regulator